MENSNEQAQHNPSPPPRPSPSLLPKPTAETSAPGESTPASTKTTATKDSAPGGSAEDHPVTETIQSPEKPPASPEVSTPEPRPQQEKPDEDGTNQVCRRCGKSQPLSQFIPKRTRRDDTYTRDCLTCRDKQAAQYQKRHEKETRDAKPGEIVCVSCMEALPEVEFRTVAGEDGSAEPGRPRNRKDGSKFFRQCLACRIVQNPARCSDCARPLSKSEKAEYDDEKRGARDRLCLACISASEAADSSSSAPVATPEARGAQTKRPHPSSPKQNTGAAKKARLAETKEEPLDEGVEDEANGAVDDPLTGLDPSVAESTDKGGETSKTTIPATKATPLVGETTPIDLRDDLFLFRSPALPLPQPRVPATTTTAAATTATSPDASTTTPAKPATSPAESAPWNLPHDASMPIPEPIFIASRTYLFTGQLPPLLLTGKNSLDFLQRHMIDFLGLALPTLQPVLADRAACAKLREAFLRRLLFPEEGGGGLSQQFLEGLEKGHSAFGRLLRDRSVMFRLRDALEVHMERLGFSEEELEKYLRDKKERGEAKAEMATITEVEQKKKVGLEWEVDMVD
ncbi:hypothetical protein PG985_003592 [Apiospora marii]|uniref:Uncharacterized protein n=1 Tax=Apiospora marii TaxID=335849 RepID=A0ABR1SI30_9PEZI